MLRSIASSLCVDDFSRPPASKGASVRLLHRDFSAVVVTHQEFDHAVGRRRLRGCRSNPWRATRGGQGQVTDHAHGQVLFGLTVHGWRGPGKCGMQMLDDLLISRKFLTFFSSSTCNIFFFLPSRTLLAVVLFRLFSWTRGRERGGGRGPPRRPMVVVGPRSVLARLGYGTSMALVLALVAEHLALLLGAEILSPPRSVGFAHRPVQDRHPKRRRHSWRGNISRQDRPPFEAGRIQTHSENTFVMIARVTGLGDRFFEITELNMAFSQVDAFQMSALRARHFSLRFTLVFRSLFRNPRFGLAGQSRPSLPRPSARWAGGRSRRQPGHPPDLATLRTPQEPQPSGTFLTSLSTLSARLAGAGFCYAATLKDGLRSRLPTRIACHVGAGATDLTNVAFVVRNSHSRSPLAKPVSQAPPTTWTKSSSEDLGRDGGRDDVVTKSEDRNITEAPANTDTEYHVPNEAPATGTEDDSTIADIKTEPDTHEPFEEDRPPRHSGHYHSPELSKRDPLWLCSPVARTEIPQASDTCPAPAAPDTVPASCGLVSWSASRCRSVDRHTYRAPHFLMHSRCTDLFFPCCQSVQSHIDLHAPAWLKHIV